MQGFVQQHGPHGRQVEPFKKGGVEEAFPLAGDTSSVEPWSCFHKHGEVEGERAQEGLLLHQAETGAEELGLEAGQIEGRGIRHDPSLGEPDGQEVSIDTGRGGAEPLSRGGCLHSLL